MNKHRTISLLLALTLLLAPLSTKASAEEPEAEQATVTAPTGVDEADRIDEQLEEDIPEEQAADSEEPPETTEDPEAEEAATDLEEYVEEFDISALFPDYRLDDYEGVLYGSGTVADNGCSVCCLASVATYLTGHLY